MKIKKNLLLKYSAPLAPLMNRLLQRLDFKDRAVCFIHTNHIAQNLEQIHAQVPHSLLCPMIKANAYGHGDTQVARALEKKKNLYGFGVASLLEGERVRKSLKKNIPILIFAGGASPWTKQIEYFCRQNKLTPVISSEIDFLEFIRLKSYLHLPYELKWNTGMNRLGMEPDFLSSLREKLSTLPSGALPQGVLTHFACAENPKHPITRKQIKEFQNIHAALAPLHEKIHFHCSNSAAIWNHKKLGLSQNITSVVRPGLALYGAPPFPKAAPRGLLNGMSVFIKVLQKRTLRAGDCVGYGAHFKAERGQKISVLVLAAGYADGFHRSLSPSKKKASVYYGNKKHPFLGRVSMDLIAVQGDSKIQAGDWVEVYGENLNSWQQAEAAGTIPYELYTSISTRVKKVYA